MLKDPSNDDDPVQNQNPGPDESAISHSASTDAPVLDPVENIVAPESMVPDVEPAPPVEQVYRHSLPVRLAHWLSVICLPILVMSGFQIFNAHQALYWGDRSDRDRPLLSVKAMRVENGEVKGVTTILGHSFDTTGVLGFSSGSVRGFPAWATILLLRKHRLRRCVSSPDNPRL